LAHLFSGWFDKNGRVQLSSRFYLELLLHVLAVYAEGQQACRQIDHAAEEQAVSGRLGRLRIAPDYGLVEFSCRETVAVLADEGGRDGAVGGRVDKGALRDEIGAEWLVQLLGDQVELGCCPAYVDLQGEL